MLGSVWSVRNPTGTAITGDHCCIRMTQSGGETLVRAATHTWPLPEERHSACRESMMFAHGYVLCVCAYMSTCVYAVIVLCIGVHMCMSVFVV